MQKITSCSTVAHPIKLVWLDLNSSYAHASLALPAIHAQVTPAHSVQEWERVSATINEQPGAVVRDICQRKPDVLAATAWLFTHEALLHILSRVKVLLPQCHILLGGPEFLGGNEEFLRKNRFVDCVFRGEGEENVLQWLEHSSEKESRATIPGLCFLDESGAYRDYGTARVKDFAALVSPQKSPFFNWDKPFVQLETTRGCFNTCAFCVSGGEKPVRTLPLTDIRERLTEIHNHGIRNVRVLDRTFNYNNSRAKELLHLFKEFVPDICFHLEMHPALLSEELKHELSLLPPGLLHLEAGIQSLREPVLEASRRIGKLSDALEGLRFLCNLENMEVHADLIAGLPLYRLPELFEDVRTLAEYGAGEIQLESLKVLPGTEMRRRAAELGIQYAPLPPYEVLQTREMSAEELQTSRLLSRLLDGFYNSVWREVTRSLIVNESLFLESFLNYLVQLNVIESPMSSEKRGLILYEFCKTEYPAYLSQVSVAWIEAGMSLKKTPAERVKTKRVSPPDTWDIRFGTYHEKLRLCFLPVTATAGYWFGFETESQVIRPVFKAHSHSYPVYSEKE